MQIAEPGEGQTSPAKRRVALGIDLGTTHSLVAHFNGRETQVFADASSGRRTMPSVVRFTQEAITVGEAALAAAIDDPLNTVASVKRYMGRALDDIDGSAMTLTPDHGLSILTERGPVTPVEVSAEILRSLAARASNDLPEPPAGVVITVPAYFDDAQRQATQQAAALAGLKVLRLINEPTAAAVAYGLDESVTEGAVLAVYDLGGGTFDLSLLKMHRGVFEVLATGGDTALGGDDIDQAIADWLLSQVEASPASSSELRQLLMAARQAKEALSSVEIVDVDVSVAGGVVCVSLTRAQLEVLMTPLIARTKTVCTQVLEDAAIDRVDCAVLVGGSTRSPLVQSTVADLFAVTPLCSIDPDEVVAMGAARQADILVGNRGDNDPLLLDVIPLSLGVETYGGLVERIIPRNSTIPVSMAQEFTTAKDGQTGLIVNVVQGERERVEDCRTLAQFSLHGIPAMVAGAARIRVTFQVDADGLLSVTATEETTGVQADVVVKPAFGLEQTDIASMLRAGYEYAAEDMAARQWAEAALEAEQLLDGIRTALESDGDLLNAEERAVLDATLIDLASAAKDSGDRNIESLRNALHETGAAAEQLAARRMDRSIREALAGVGVDQLVVEDGVP